MVYMGGKARIAKHIAPIVNEAIKKSNGMLFEPFCGGCNITPYFEGRVFANDLNENLIYLFKEALAGRVFPEYITREMHAQARTGAYDKALTAYILFCASFSGMYGRAYVGNGYPDPRGGKPKDRQAELIKSFNKTVEALRGMPALTLSSRPYDELDIPDGSVIYCDPPYEGASGYKTGRFDHGRFWEWAEKMSERNRVFVSEYSTRSNLFIPIWKKNINNSLSRSSKQTTEVLFTSLIN